MLFLVLFVNPNSLFEKEVRIEIVLRILRTISELYQYLPTISLYELRQNNRLSEEYQIPRDSSHLCSFQEGCQTLLEMYKGTQLLARLFVDTL